MMMKLIARSHFFGRRPPNISELDIAPKGRFQTIMLSEQVMMRVIGLLMLELLLQLIWMKIKMVCVSKKTKAQN